MNFLGNLQTIHWVELCVFLSLVMLAGMIAYLLNLFSKDE